MCNFIKWRDSRPYPTEELILVRAAYSTNDKVMTAKEYCDAGYESAWICVSDLERMGAKIATEATPRMESTDA